MSIADSKQRFSSRVENYIKYRPSYPAGVIDLLKEECGLNENSVIADIGSGTGILSELLLKTVLRVFGVEPNKEMREAGERFLTEYSSFTSVAASAEDTTLPDNSIDIITASQAFHWFDRAKAKAEFRRILKPGGWVALIWNDRVTTTIPFLIEYERLLQTYSTDYKVVNHKELDPGAIGSFFEPGSFNLKKFENRQLFDFQSLKGRMLSSSYAPEEGHPNHEITLEKLREIFDKYNVEGKVAFEYETAVYYGRLGK
ncbi:MAG: class I SAM-dependent methyltransferase [Chloroflexia bacterium]